MGWHGWTGARKRAEWAQGSRDGAGPGWHLWSGFRRKGKVKTHDSIWKTTSRVCGSCMSDQERQKSPS